MKKDFLKLFNSKVFEDLLAAIEYVAENAEEVIVTNTKTGETVSIFPDMLLWCTVETRGHIVHEQAYALVAATEALLILTPAECKDLENIDITFK